jgi:Holliday junction resolvase
MTNWPVRLVLLVSEQLLPSLEFALHMADRYGAKLQTIHLYCTDDERRSIEPAQRLERSLRRWLDARSLSTKVERVQGSMQPEDVRQGLLRCFEAAPDVHWLVNVTGGNKLMSAAAIELSLSTDLSSCRVIYREINGRWYELKQDEGEGFLRTLPIDQRDDPDVPPADTLDRLMSVDDLVIAQFPGQHRCEANAVRPLPIRQALDLVFTRERGHRRWRWEALYPLLPGVQPVSGGDAFERFIAAGLESCGIRVRHSLKLLDTLESGEQTKIVREIDIVACHKGRLVCIDIKLPDAEDSSKGTQLADIADLARQLGGNAAVAIALRPGWPADPEVGRLARALQVHLLTQADAPAVFQKLVAAIDRNQQDLPLPEPLKAAQEHLADLAGQGHSVLSDRRKVKTELPLSNSGRLNAIDELRAVGESRQQGWTLLLVPGGILVWVSRTSPHHAGCNGKQCELLVKKLLQASRANGTGRWVTLVDGAAEFCGIVKGSVSARVIEQTLKDVLNTRR